MTIEQIIAHAELFNFRLVLAFFLAPPIIVLALGLGRRRGRLAYSPRRYLFTIIIYWVSLPGILAGLLTGYTLFFLRQNLLQVNVVLYFLPLVSMIVTLVLIRRQVEWDDVPGVERLFAFITLIALTFFIMLAILKMRLLVLFHGSIFLLALVGLVCYLILKFSFKKLSRPRRLSQYGLSSRTYRSQTKKDLRRLKKRL